MLLAVRQHLKLRFSRMISSAWMHDHEFLSALVYIVLSLAFIGAFSWIERRYLQK
ncbi:MAG TPA: hypothetical protein VJW20_17825 [Candidatus Angelobacter sp.]|nr:hypothetical protein [Candidatus Angelobacter sp.]